MVQKWKPLPLPPSWRRGGSTFKKGLPDAGCFLSTPNHKQQQDKIDHHQSQRGDNDNTFFLWLTAAARLSVQSSIVF
jgi:hypothetical protein